MRDTLLDENVKDAAVDYDAGLAYLIPEDGYTAQEAIAALGKSGKYTATRQP
ncbi:MAG: hypothetical protein P1V36_03250 [Planctomycetota bacterium]|nr:hypothetical protein [Planctomycetota bacterium]